MSSWVARNDKIVDWSGFLFEMRSLRKESEKRNWVWDEVLGVARAFFFLLFEGLMFIIWKGECKMI